MNITRRRLAFALGILRQRPFQCLVQVTNRCNMQCGFCEFWRNPAAPREELTVADYRRLAGEMASLGRFLVSIEGGEPLLRRDIVDIVRTFSQQHLAVLYTNGWHITEPVAQNLFAAGLARIGVSLDFPDSQRHDAHRGRAGAYDRAIEAIRILRRAAPEGQRQVHIMTVLTEENLADLEAMLKLSESLQVGHCLTLLSTQGTRRGQALHMPGQLNAEMLLDLWKRYPHLYLLRDYLRGMADFSAGKETGSCAAASQSFNIDHIGQVSPCIERISEVYGNVQSESLPGIWRRMVAAAPAQGCNRCWTLCRGLSQALSQHGTLRAWHDLARRM